MEGRRMRGRALWQPPASCPPEIADAVRRLIALWAEWIETPRLHPSPAAGGGGAPRGGGVPVRFDATHRRCRSVQAVLMGMYHRQAVTEAELADAIRCYAASAWHRRQRAWQTLGDWLADEDTLLRWVVDGRVAAERRARGPARPGPVPVQHREDAAAAAKAAALAGRVNAEIERLRRDEPGRLAELARDALEAMPLATRAMIYRAHRGEGPTVGNDKLVLLWVRQRIGERLDGTEDSPQRR